MKRSGWFLVHEDRTVFAIRNGQERWVPVTKRGIPAGAFDFVTEEAARSEAEHMRNIGHWPLYSPVPKRLTW